MELLALGGVSEAGKFRPPEKPCGLGLEGCSRQQANLEAGTRIDFGPHCVFNNMASFVFRFVFGSFFQQERVFNNFSASFFGSFQFVFEPFLFRINMFSGSFFKKVFFCPISPTPQDIGLNDFGNSQALNSPTGPLTHAPLSSPQIRLAC
jgi:hypothetical protein